MVAQAEDVLHASDPNLVKPFKAELPVLDLSVPAPNGSLREGVDEIYEAAQKKNRSKTNKRERRDSQHHLYVALGGLVNNALNSFGAREGLLLIEYFNDAKRFPRAGAHYASTLKRHLIPLVGGKGLSAEFVSALDEVERQVKGDDVSEPFKALHYRQMHGLLVQGQSPDYCRGLYLVGCDAGPQILDATLLQWEGVHFDTGMVQLYREKTEILAEFKTSPALREWLERRRREAAPDDIYVFWELVCKKRDRKRPDWNKVVVTDENRLASISSNATRLWREFLDAADIKEGEYTYSSFRKQYISFNRSINTKDEVIMKTVGQADARTQVKHYRWIAEHELERVQEVNTRHNNAMLEGKREFYPTTAFDLYEWMELRLAKLQGDLEQKIDVGLKALENRLLTAIASSAVTAPATPLSISSPAAETRAELPDIENQVLSSLLRNNSGVEDRIMPAIA
ncbi:MAG: hypothetical protein ABSH34_25340 [Verrucomicrobiota bacterium]